jgi:hypothetical protein
MDVWQKIIIINFFLRLHTTYIKKFIIINSSLNFFLCIIVLFFIFLIDLKLK